MKLTRRHILSLFAAAAVLAAGILNGPMPTAVAANDPGSFVTELKNDAVKQLTDAGVDEALKEQRFRALLNDHFEVEDIGRFVIGRYWRGASEEDRKQFLKVFEDVLVQRFLPVFDDYANQRFTVSSVRKDDKRPEFSTVSSTVSQPQGADAQVLWRIRETNGRYRISDVKAEGISLRITYRSEYASFLKNNSGDINKLSKLLSEKVKSGAFAPK